MPDYQEMFLPSFTKFKMNNYNFSAVIFKVIKADPNKVNG